MRDEIIVDLNKIPAVVLKKAKLVFGNATWHDNAVEVSNEDDKIAYELDGTINASKDEVTTTITKDGKMVEYDVYLSDPTKTPEKVLEDMLQIGAITLQQSHGESMVRQIENSMDNLAKVINIEANEKFPQQIKTKTEDLMKDLSKYLDPKIVGSIQQQIDKVLSTQMNEQTALLQKELKVHYAMLKEGFEGLNRVKVCLTNPAPVPTAASARPWAASRGFTVRTATSSAPAGKISTPSKPASAAARQPASSPP